MEHSLLHQITLWLQDVYTAYLALRIQHSLTAFQLKGFSAFAPMVGCTINETVPSPYFNVFYMFQCFFVFFYKLASESMKIKENQSNPSDIAIARPGPIKSMKSERSKKVIPGDSRGSRFFFKIWLFHESSMFCYQNTTKKQ